MTRRRSRAPSSPRTQLLLAAALSAIAVAACGSSGARGARDAQRGQFLAFSECMRSHGVPNFPDPGPSGGIQIQPAEGINPFSPSFRAAQGHCSKLLPGGGPGSQKPSATVEAQLLAVARCMRRHGVTGFPDPTTSPPASPAPYSQILGQGGVFLAVPKTIDVSSPAYVAAAKTCHFGRR
jgi:hypothetical protein